VYLVKFTEQLSRGWRCLTELTVLYLIYVHIFRRFSKIAKDEY